jgi:hypothetical protein
MSKAKYDPLEAAKVAPDGGKVTKSDKTFVDAPPPPPTASEAPKPPDQEPPAPVAPRPRYRVLEARRVSVNGQSVVMAAGRVLDSAGYGGDAGIARLVSQGLKLGPA